MSAAFAVAIFLLIYTLIASERISRLAAALLGAALLLITGIMDTHDAFFSPDSGVDWNVIFLLLGMMIIVGITGQTGLFEYLGTQAVKLARGQPRRVMTILIVFTALGSALLDNVTMILLTAPITLAMCKQIGVQPMPYLLAQVFASNIGGAATLIGDPPNIIIGSKAGLSFNDFIVNLAPIAAITTVALVFLCKVLFRDAFVVDSRSASPVEIDARSLISDPRLLLKSLVVLTLVLIGFVLHSVTHLEPAVVAIVGAGLLVAISGTSLGKSVEEVEWETLVFFMALFVITGALVKTGVIEHLATLATDAMGDRLLLGTVGLVGISGVLSGLVDNIPYVAVMTPLVGQVVADSQNSNADVLWWALALGADFGGNATIVGASANVVMLGIAKKQGYDISFWQFMKKGSLVAITSMVLAAAYLWLRYFVVGG